MLAWGAKRGDRSLPATVTEQTRPLRSVPAQPVRAGRAGPAPAAARRHRPAPAARHCRRRCSRPSGLQSRTCGSPRPRSWRAAAATAACKTWRRLARTSAVWPVGEPRASQAWAAPNAKVAVSMQRHQGLERTRAGRRVRALNQAPMARACTRPSSFRLRWVAQLPSANSGGSNVPGANAWRNAATTPPRRSSAGNSWCASAAQAGASTPAASPANNVWRRVGIGMGQAPWGVGRRALHGRPGHGFLPGASGRYTRRRRSFA